MSSSPPPPYKRFFRPHAKFSAADDTALRLAVAVHGICDWTAVSLTIGDRSPRQCKERWFNYLAPDLKVDAWTLEEDHRLLEKYSELGHKWVKIARFFPNRTDAMVKNRYHQLQRKKLSRRKSRIAPAIRPEEREFTFPEQDPGQERPFASLADVADEGARLWGNDIGEIVRWTFSDEL